MRAEEVAKGLAAMECPPPQTHPWVEPAQGAKVAVVSTAGLCHRGDPPFSFGGADYRVIDRQDARDVVMSHISTNFDRSGFTQDLNVVLPLERLDELAGQGAIGSVSRWHYSFMGATDPAQMAPAVGALVDVMMRDEVDVVLLVPV
ncbi:MAG: glycine/betaine/sarcosine/D-proline family reductase selenoprotein B [Pseudomonadaceae bacterium]|nr:glycine/betaine/sarcosine/D-proline family reductase selenoprotein B [Pseudomonadaceae bacterium]